MNKVREFLKGKKAYITAAVGLLGAVIAWADGQIDGVALCAAVWAAAQACFIRAGIDNTAVKSRKPSDNNLTRIRFHACHVGDELSLSRSPAEDLTHCRSLVWLGFKAEEPIDNRQRQYDRRTNVERLELHEGYVFAEHIDAVLRVVLCNACSTATTFVHPGTFPLVAAGFRSGPVYLLAAPQCQIK